MFCFLLLFLPEPNTLHSIGNIIVTLDLPGNVASGLVGIYANLYVDWDVFCIDCCYNLRSGHS